MSDDIPILIVGAGPTGLMLACELARRHIPFRIIDKNSSPTVTSNATEDIEEYIKNGNLSASLLIDDVLTLYTNTLSLISRKRFTKRSDLLQDMTWQKRLGILNNYGLKCGLNPTSRIDVCG